MSACVCGWLFHGLGVCVFAWVLDMLIFVCLADGLSVELIVDLFVGLSVCLHVCGFACVFGCLCVCLFVCVCGDCLLVRGFVCVRLFA